MSYGDRGCIETATCQPAPPDESICTALEQLGKEIETLSAAVDSLIGAVDHVLIPIATAPSGPEGGPPASGSPVYVHVRELHWRVAQIAKTTNAAQRRVNL